MKTIEINLYSIHELDDNAKEYALSKWCNNDHYFRDSANIASLKEFANIFPVLVRDYDYGYRNFINWRFTQDDKIENLTDQRLATYLYNNFKSTLYPKKIYWTKNHAKRRTSKIKIITGNCPLTGYYVDDILLEPIYKFIQSPKNTINFHDLLDDCLQSWIFACNEDYEYSLSMEAFIETCEANDHYFTSNGTIQ